MYTTDKIVMRGPLNLEEFEIPAPGNPQKSPFLDATIPLSSQVWTANNTGRLIYDKQTGTIWYGDGVRESFRTLNDIPYGSIVLFETDTQQLGYTLLTNDNDGVVYYTNNSGGDLGGQLKSGGTWTSPPHSHITNEHTHTGVAHNHTISHIHTGASHTHTTSSTTLDISTMAAHRHPPYLATWIGVSVAANGEGGGSTSGTFQWTGFTGGYEAHNHGNTSASSVTFNQSSINNTSTDGTESTSSSSGVTQSATAFTNWRPIGINYTRQQRN